MKHSLNMTDHVRVKEGIFCMLYYPEGFIRAKKVGISTASGCSGFIAEETLGVSSHQPGETFAKNSTAQVIPVSSDSFSQLEEGYFFFQNQLCYKERESQRAIFLANEDESSGELLIEENEQIWVPMKTLAPAISIDDFNDVIEEEIIDEPINEEE